MANFPVHANIVVDFTNMLISNFAIEYLHENEKFRESVLAY